MDGMDPRILSATRRFSDSPISPLLADFTLLSPLAGQTPRDQPCHAWLLVKPAERLNWHATISCPFARVVVLARGFASIGLRPSSGEESRSKGQFHTCLDCIRIG